MIKVEVHGYPTQYLVYSETETDAVYLVWLTDPRYRIRDKFNGSCTCSDFKYRCRKRIKDSGYTVFCRCKHLKSALSECLDTILVHLASKDPNMAHDAENS